MTHAAEELQAAMIALMRADATLSGLLGAGRVEDGPRRGAAYPSIAPGGWISRPVAGDAWPGEEHRLEFLVFSRAGGRKEALGLMDRLVHLVEGATITLAEHRLVNLSRTGESIARTRDGRTWRGVVTWRAVSEPAGIA